MINRISQSVILVELLIGRSKWSYTAFVGALDLWKQMELRSICWGCLGPLEANGATLHLLGMPSSTDHLTIVFNTMSIHKSSSYQTYTAIQSIVHQSSISLLTTSVYTTLVVFLSSCPCWKITNTLDGWVHRDKPTYSCP